MEEKMKVNLVDEKRFTPVKLEITLESQKEVDQFHALASHADLIFPGDGAVRLALNPVISNQRDEAFRALSEKIESIYG
jgi:hypothetical protein